MRIPPPKADAPPEALRCPAALFGPSSRCAASTAPTRRVSEAGREDLHSVAAAGGSRGLSRSLGWFDRTCRHRSAGTGERQDVGAGGVEVLGDLWELSNTGARAR